MDLSCKLRSSSRLYDSEKANPPSHLGLRTFDPSLLYDERAAPIALLSDEGIGALLRRPTFHSAGCSIVLEWRSKRAVRAGRRSRAGARNMIPQQKLQQARDDRSGMNAPAITGAAWDRILPLVARCVLHWLRPRKLHRDDKRSNTGGLEPGRSAARKQPTG
jgi:hypothetical protein